MANLMVLAEAQEWAREWREASPTTWLQRIVTIAVEQRACFDDHERLCRYSQCRIDKAEWRRALAFLEDEANAALTVAIIGEQWADVWSVPRMAAARYN